VPRAAPGAAAHPPLAPVGADAPVAVATQVPSDVHSAGKTQSATDRHDVLHSVPEQRYGLQSTRVPSGAWSVCMPSHEAAESDTHVPLAASHRKLVAQSASAAHEVAHPAPAQKYGAQVDVVGFSHAPCPVHLPAAVATPSAHAAGRHTVSGPTYPAQVSRTVPSQLAALQTLPPLAAWQAGRPCCGAPLTGTHVPDSPGTSQASHCPWQTVLQHTPSTQNGALDGQAAGSVHAWPGARLAVHTPDAQ
jgi:hypothetical protein